MQIYKNEVSRRFAKIWVPDLAEVEPQALAQIDKMLAIPGLFRHAAIMPDVHLGSGAVIGSVVATQKVIFPNIVGVDIGCGMSAFCTHIALDAGMDAAFWHQWQAQVQRTVPVGFATHKSPRPLFDLDRDLSHPNLSKILHNKAGLQLGTLGGGNHFLEAQRDTDGIVWFMVHSGSRKTGLEIAAFHTKKAQAMNERYFSQTPKDLWFLRVEDEEGQAYLSDMAWATAFALESRWQMLEALVFAFADLAQLGALDMPPVRDAGINIHHNYAAMEHHFGENVLVHRKGATRARAGEIGIIPGSMGSPSYIVEGLGNEESFTSCSHGAGRAMGRNHARATLQMADFERAMQGTYTKVGAGMIDEAPGAYKSIGAVMANQTDLVRIKASLSPLISVKGESPDEG